MGIYIGDVATREAANKQAVNLDDVTEQTLPMLNNTSKSHDIVSNTSGNEASSEASDHVSNSQCYGEFANLYGIYQ